MSRIGRREASRTRSFESASCWFPPSRQYAGAPWAPGSTSCSPPTRVVATNARLISGFLKIGLRPGGGYFTISSRTAGREATAAMGLFQQEISGARAAELGMAWTAVDDDSGDIVAIELASRPASDRELSREATRSFRAEAENGAMGWAGGLQFERAVQMWSQSRRPDAQKS